MVKRTFIAQIIPVSEKLKNHIESIRENIAGLNIKWVEFHNLHLTIMFLGETTSQQEEEIRKNLENIVQNYRNYKIRLTKIGVFRSTSNPQVLWIGIEAEDTLTKLYSDIQELVGNLGFAKDTRPYKPHLTIGRIKSFSTENNLKEIIKEGADIDELVTANTIVYFESILTAAGPEYKAIQTFKF